MSGAVCPLRVVPVCTMRLGFLAPYDLVIFFALILVKHAQLKPFHINCYLVQQLRDIRYLCIATMPFQDFPSATNSISSIKCPL